MVQKGIERSSGALRVAKKKSGSPRRPTKGKTRDHASKSPGIAARTREPAKAPLDPSKPPIKPEVVVVGIGTSAGGLSALREFFHNVADDSGLAYVVVVHLSPEHESHLATLLQPHSKMKVVQVSDSVPLRPNCVYVIPPNANLSAIDTHLRLSALEERRDQRRPSTISSARSRRPTMATQSG